MKILSKYRCDSFRAVLLAVLLVCSGLFLPAAAPVHAVDAESSSLKYVFIYAKSADDKNVLLKVAEMKDLRQLAQGNSHDGDADYSFSYTDNFPASCYSQARGFTIPELVNWLKTESTAAASLTFAGDDGIRFMPTDGTGYLKRWDWQALYGVDRYYFPGFYDAATGWKQSWETAGGGSDANYEGNPSDNQYHDEGKDATFTGGIRSEVILAVSSSGGRVSRLGDEIAANGGAVTGCLANQMDEANALRLHFPQTEQQMRTGERSAGQYMYGIFNILFEPDASTVQSAGTVSTPTLSAFRSGEALTVSLSCETDGAELYYSVGSDGSTQNKYTGPFEIPYTAGTTPTGISVRAVKEGFGDAGLVKLQPSVDPYFSLESASSGVTVGSTVKLDICLNDADGNPFYGAQVQIAVNPSNWTISKVTPDGKIGARVQEIRDSSGKITGVQLSTESAVSLPPNLAEKKLHLGQLELKAEKSGSGQQIGFSQAALLDETKQPYSVDAKSLTIDVTAKNGSGGKGSGSSTEPQKPDVTTEKKADAGGLTRFSQAELASSDILRVLAGDSADQAILVFDKDAVKALRTAAKQGLEVRTQKVGPQDLPEAQQAALAEKLRSDVPGDLPAYRFELQSGGQKITALNGGSVTITLDYALKSGEKGNDLIVARIREDGSVDWITDCSYNSQSGKLTFNVSNLSCFLIAGAAVQNVKFTDVSVDSWYHDSVTYLANRGIISGKAEGIFAPGAGITRAELIRILYNMAPEIAKGEAPNPHYTDVSEQHWYYHAVAWGTRWEIVQGAGGLFRPNDQISRQELAVMLQRYNEKVVNLPLPSENTAASFSDSGAVASWAADAVQAMQRAGIINGIDHGNGAWRFAPANGASRAEAAKMMAEYLQRVS